MSPLIGEISTCDVSFAELADGFVDPNIDGLILSDVHVEKPLAQAFHVGVLDAAQAFARR